MYFKKIDEEKETKNLFIKIGRKFIEFTPSTHHETILELPFRNETVISYGYWIFAHISHAKLHIIIGVRMLDYETKSFLFSRYFIRSFVRSFAVYPTLIS